MQLKKEFKQKQLNEKIIKAYLFLNLKPPFTNETSMICLTQTRIKIHHASSIRPIINKLFTDEKL
jgi:hypothetical protein